MLLSSFCTVVNKRRLVLFSSLQEVLAETTRLYLEGLTLYKYIHTSLSNILHDWLIQNIFRIHEADLDAFGF